jgi:hypothetical protein
MTCSGLGGRLEECSVPFVAARRWSVATRPVRALKYIGVVAIFVITAVLAGRRVRRQASARRIEELQRPATVGRDQRVQPDDIDELPDPVRRYLSSALPAEQPCVDAVRLEQDGELRLGDASSPWKSFTATQHITVDPPGFLWDASIRLAPLVSVGVRDLYRDGEGFARVSLFGLLPLDGVAPSPELNEAELLRYLAEAVWYPTALLPSEGVIWEPIDDSTAKATIERGDVSASLEFSFNEDDEVTRVYAEERHRRVDGGFEPTPWSGYWHDYQTRDGMRVPTAGEVVWHLPDGDLEAWRGRVTEISYDDW